MAAFYTTEDVLRWEENALKNIPFQTKALREPGISLDKQWQRYGFLSGSYYSLTMIAISRKQFDRAREFLRQSVEMDFQQFEVELALESPMDAGNFQAVLLAYVVNEPWIISKVLNYYRWEKGVPESVFIGKIIKSLALGDLKTAEATLAQKRPRIEKMFEAYPDCLRAMLEKNPVALQVSINLGSKTWARRAARFEKGLPDAVCFLQGAGLVRMAQHVMGGRVAITDENIPAELIS